MKKKRHSVPKKTEQSLEDQALAHLNAKRYKDAIRLYKKLLQEADNNEWHQQLAFSYVQRAISFANREMYAEAVALWENHQEHVQAPYAAYEQYLVWLMQTNQLVKVQAELAQLSVEQLDKEHPKLAAVLGLLILTQYPELQQHLPQGSAFIAHLQLVQTALQALQDNQPEQLNAALTQLPYRSVFRDLRTLLNAVALMADSPEQAATILAKISNNSVYYPAAHILIDSLLSGAELAQQLVGSGYAQRSVISELKGLSAQQLDFIEHFSRKQDKLTDKVQFNMAIQYQALIGTELAEQFCQLMLASYPAGKKDFNKHFSSSSEFEENRIQALLCEQSNHLEDAEFHWQRCIRCLLNTEGDNGLQIALILRRLAVREPDGLERADLFAQSIEHDASDRNSYLQILKEYGGKEGDAQEYKLWLNKTLAQFPQDIAVLTQAVQAATRNKTYKKASQYARKILSIDPLNTFAKQTLFSSHAAHAQRLMREKKYELVAKEIEQLEKLNLGKSYQQKIQLMQALLGFASEDKQQGLQNIAVAVKSIYADPVNIQFNVAMAALLNGLPVTTLLRELPSSKEHLLTVAELNNIMQQLQQHIDASIEHTLLHKALEKIKAPLKKSLLTQGYVEPLLLQFCEKLDAIKHFELLRHIAKFAQDQWQSPIWMYYRVYATCNGDAADCSGYDEYRLQNAHKQAQESKEYQTCFLIDHFLDSYYEAHPQRSLGFLDSLFGLDGDDEDEDMSVEIMEQLFGSLPEDTLAAMNYEMEAIAQKQTPEQLIQGLMQQADNSEMVFMAMMQNPDIFSAFLLLKAAEKLKIDIGVGVDDVIEAFGIKENNSRFPFPF
ncbi:MAG: hypothetical protein GQ581_04400 [Methyloprofundus sp.]|nr:hypothetical protein [Methyloprofundus sp.]